MIQALDINTPKGQTRYIIETDPTKSFTRISEKDIINSLGLIPQIMFSPKQAHLNMWDALDAGYQHGGGLLVMEGQIDQDLSYIFTGGQPLKPLVKYTRGNEVAYQYQYGIMMVEKDGELTATRMD